MKIIFFGSSGFAVPMLEVLAKSEDVALVVTQPDREKGRSLKVAPTVVKLKAEKLGIKVFQPQKINTKESIDFLKKFNADLFVVVSFGQILSKAVLSLPGLYCLNIHASLLPKYRGAAPISWAIANGEKETGVTIMRMNEKMDEGDVALKGIVPIFDQEDASMVSEKLSIRGAELLSEAVRLVKDSKIDFTLQDDKGASYAPKLKKEDGRIDWNLSAEAISCRVRAFTPWPGCFTYLDKKILKICKVMSVSLPGELSGSSDRQIKSEPGTIIEVNKQVILVKTGKGILNIQELQLEGSRRMTAKEFIAGHKQFSSGAVLKQLEKRRC